ncbi:MAG: FAD-dependent oxidoreductase [Candidatus Aminicenantes bacterium]|nr:FAD-dependent oxidoreductase [Candidatus Aminicenantes bacterium]
MSIRINIDGKNIDAFEGQPILQAALKAGIYIPHLCFHPDLPSFKESRPDALCYQGENEFRSDSKAEGYEGCGLCLVEIDGRKDPVLSCVTEVEEGIKIVTSADSVQSLRRDKMAKIIAGYPFDECEMCKVAEYIGLKEDIGRYVPRDLTIEDSKPLFIRDYNLCISCLRCVRVCSDLVGAKSLGYTSSKGTITVGTKKPSIEESGCVYCGACVEVCPTGALRDKDLKPGDRKEALIPCKASCPLDMDVPTYVQFIAQASFDEAARTIREKTPMGLSLGYICPHPCEAVCRRGEISQPIAICNLKRLAMETKDAIVTEKTVTAPPTGKKVAVVGAGPAGLVAAFYLTVFGHDVSVFEASTEAGGMLRWAVPEYRLPRQIIKHEIRTLEAMGVSIQTNSSVDTKFFSDELDQKQWDAVFLATGAQAIKKIDIEGHSLLEVYWGLDFLREVKEGWAPEVGENVVVVGGGNMALDAAMTSLRLGAEKVVIACLEKRDEMPAYSWKIDETEKEGILIQPGWGIKKIVGDGTSVSGVELMRCAAVFNKKGHFCPVYDESATITIKADSVILAFGQKSDVDYLPPDSGIQMHKDGALKTNPNSLETDKPGFFAGGESRSGPASAVEAMAEGRLAASSIDRYLGGCGLDEGRQEERFFDKGLLWRGRKEKFYASERADMAELPVEERTGSFAVPQLGYCAGEAQAEAERCLKCHLRFLISPVMLPPKKGK